MPEVAEGGGGAVRSPEDDDEQCHPEGAPHLSRRLIDRAANCKTLGVQARHRRRTEYGKRETDAETGDQGGR
jgi:hypothetical protein